MWRKMLKLLLRMGNFNIAENHHHEKTCFQESMFSKRDFDQEPCQQMCTESSRYTKKVVHNIQKYDFQFDSMRVCHLGLMLLLWLRKDCRDTNPERMPRKPCSLATLDSTA